VNGRAAKTTTDSTLRGVWLVPFFANTVLVQAVTFVLRPTAIYRALELDVPTQWLGALGASFAIVPLVLAIPSGLAADRWGERRVMVFGGVLTLLAAGCFVVAAHSVWGLLAASVVLGTGHLCSVVGQQSMVANNTPSHRYDSAFGHYTFGHYTFAASAGQAIGPALIVLFGGSAAIPDTQTIFEWATGLGVMLVGASLFLPRVHATTTAAAAAVGSVLQLLRRRGLVPALTVSCIVLSAVDISLVYLPALGAEQDIAAGTIGILLAVRAGASMVSRLFLGRLVTLVGRRTLLTTSVGVAAMGMALLPVPMTLWLLVVVIAATGLGLGAGQPLTMSWLADSTPPGLRGRAMALRLTGNRFGQVVVPTVAGLVAVGAGAVGVLWITAAAWPPRESSPAASPLPRPPTPCRQRSATEKELHMSEFIPTADLYDQHGEALASCDTQFRQFGGRTRFQGEIVTVRCHEDNALLKTVVQEPGTGKVLVVDADGAVHCAMMGDKMADIAVSNSWEGVIIHGAVRDAALLAPLDIGIKAVGTNPRKSPKYGAGTKNVPVAFGGVVFTPGAVVVSDEDGVVVLPEAVPT